jgi:hypothetical protein
MAAGRPGDHPITDLMLWDLPVYGAEADAMFRRLAQLLSAQDLNSWWESDLGWGVTPEAARAAISEKLKWALSRAKANEWQVE